MVWVDTNGWEQAHGTGLAIVAIIVPFLAVMYFAMRVRKRNADLQNQVYSLKADIQQRAGEQAASVTALRAEI